MVGAGSGNYSVATGAWQLRASLMTQGCRAWRVLAPSRLRSRMLRDWSKGTVDWLLATR